VEIEKNKIQKFSQFNELVIPAKKIKPDGSVLSIKKDGEGEIYGTLVVNQFLTDKNSVAVSKGLTVTREYSNISNPGQLSFHVGDKVQIALIVSGLQSEKEYAVLQDELPSGLVPINTNLKNEQFDQNSNSNNFNYYSYNQEITENGMTMTTYWIKPGKNTYVYNARVVSEGTFAVPPAKAEIMYSPEIYGRSASETITVDNGITKNALSPIRNFAESIVGKERATFGMFMILILLLIPIGLIGYVVYRKYYSIRGL
jgi:hypothetical protein